MATPSQLQQAPALHQWNVKPMSMWIWARERKEEQKSTGWHRGWDQKEGWGERRVRNRQERENERGRTENNVEERTQGGMRRKKERWKNKWGAGKGKSAHCFVFFLPCDCPPDNRSFYPAGEIMLLTISPTLLLPTFCMPPCSVMPVRPWPPNEAAAELFYYIYLQLAGEMRCWPQPQTAAVDDDLTCDDCLNKFIWPQTGNMCDSFTLNQLTFPTPAALLLFVCRNTGLLWSLQSLWHTETHKLNHLTQRCDWDFTSNNYKFNVVKSTSEKLCHRSADAEWIYHQTCAIYAPFNS